MCNMVLSSLVIHRLIVLCLTLVFYDVECIQLHNSLGKSSVCQSEVPWFKILVGAIGYISLAHFCVVASQLTHD